ncbi:hypothetical protein HD593_006104 [Nonomuraea rubra]|uniref:Uncharacterized protein n=1 Tax=Nonomuraea rubra TaxID=46180 RepID=A0A7X0U1D2_9ACTN|nr:hypothetical protein [Nonomuraea rubra]
MAEVEAVRPPVYTAPAKEAALETFHEFSEMT